MLGYPGSQAQHFRYQLFVTPRHTRYSIPFGPSVRCTKVLCTWNVKPSFQVQTVSHMKLFRHNASFHCFAEDQTNCKDSMQALPNYLKDVKTWMELNFLKLNQNETEIFIFGQTELLACYDSVLGPLALLQPLLCSESWCDAWHYL